MEESSGIVAIVGRPNVGKSTLFNRLIGQRKAIVDNISGVTRDRIYGISHWNGKLFQVIDTGGFVPHSDDVFEEAIREQVDIAIDEADVILFMVDVSTGITDLDEDMAQKLRKTTKSVILVVNKVDNYDRQIEANEFWGLGFEETYFISATSGSGSGDLMDAVTEHLNKKEGFEPDIPKFAIIGRPNVGKSSLVNALVGKERNLVTPAAGTTRDSVHTHYSKFGKDFILVDTAGLRKKAKVKENIEFYSVMRAIRSIEEAEICFLMVDATRGMESQDLSIFSLAKDRNKGIVILVNKWDLIEKNTNTAREYEEMISDRIAPFRDVPIIFISVTEKQRIAKILDVGLDVYERRAQRISTSKLNKIMQPIIEQTPPPIHKGRTPNIKYVTQVKTYFPAFAFFCNHPDHVKSSYRQFLENQLRKHFNFTGVPIGLFFRQK